MLISSSKSLFSSTLCMFCPWSPMSVVCMCAVEGLVRPNFLARFTSVEPTESPTFRALPLCFPMI